jgi:long-subunit fatty acid transport protein
MNLDNNPTTPSTFVENDYIIDHNGWSLQTGIEVNLTEKLLVSGGYVFANKGVNDNYQSDLTYGLATHTFGAGGAFSILDNLLLNAGISYTAYVDDDKLLNHLFPDGTLYQPKETYAKRTFLFGIGLDYNF